VDDGTTTRDTIVKSWAEQTLGFLEKQVEFCKTQRQKYDSGEYKFLRPTAFRKILEKLDSIEKRIRVYIELLNMQQTEADPIIKKFEEAYAEVEKNIELASAKGESKKMKLALQAKIL
jgi:hypothetical protein